ncbi:MAG: ABC transporter ATP-binding protein [Lachnospiraceae bacterium]|nr:ABC transporter ATP-binding protein [Lachnospiraceae bacterium]
MIQLNDLSIGYGGEAILEHMDMDFNDGLIYGILAKSGVGKTTLLKTIAGLIPPVKGHVSIDGVCYRTAKRNPVYMMHQRYCNFNWLSCLENVLIAQRNKRERYTDESRNNAYTALCQVGLEDCKDKWPSQLSGGMQQRLALARTLYVKPKYLLMDEPLSALDDKTRSEMQSLILDIHLKTQNTILMVTHSQDEAAKMCDQIISIGGK